MTYLSTVLVGSDDLPELFAMSDPALLEALGVSAESHYKECGIQLASVGDEDIEHVHVLRDGFLCWTSREDADAEDLRVIADVLRARGLPSRIDGRGRNWSVGEPTDREAWLKGQFSGRFLVTLVIDHSFPADAFGTRIGARITSSAHGFLASLAEQLHTAPDCGMVKPRQEDMDLMMRPPGVRKPLFISAITPANRSDVIITGKGRSGAVRPYDPGLAAAWVDSPLEDGPRKRLGQSILKGFHEIDMKVLANILLMHGYTILDGQRVTRPYLWNKENWGIRQPDDPGTD